MSNGWTAKTAEELDSTIRVWFEILSVYQIPSDAYEQLYRRAIDTRQTFLSNGKEPPAFGAELLIAGWTGANGLKKELEQRRIDSGKFLGENAASVCRHCHGSNWRTVEDKECKGYTGAVRCDHKN